ncbi:MAG: NUDIX domain-containing protein [Sediminibacterium sp.]
MKKIIKAGGGLVRNGEGELLLIFRRGKWDLPKGKLDEGETIEACALREVEEETGVKHLALGELISVTWHEYFDKWVGEDVIKETHWFKMEVAGVPALVPQTEEDITAIEWTKKSDLPKRMEQSYITIIDVLEESGWLPMDNLG